MAIEVKTTVSFQPWQVPNFASISQKPGLKQDGIQALPSIAIADLDDAVIDALTDVWLKELYAKAKRTCPFIRIEAAK